MEQPKKNDYIPEYTENILDSDKEGRLQESSTYRGAIKNILHKFVKPLSTKDSIDSNCPRQRHAMHTGMAEMAQTATNPGGLYY